MKDEMLKCVKSKKRQKTSCNMMMGISQTSPITIDDKLLSIMLLQLLLLQTRKQFVLLLVKLELP